MSEQDTRELRNCGTAEDNASQVPESDTREKLEADIAAWASKDKSIPLFARTVIITYDHLLDWLDRQAAITERELCKKCEWPSLAAMPDREAYDRIAELTAEVDSLREALEACGTGTMYELWRRDHARLEAIRAALHDKPGT